MFEIVPHSPVSVADTGQDLQLYRVGRCGCCVKRAPSNCGCGFEVQSTVLQVLICLLRLLTIIGNLITSSHGKMERILVGTSQGCQRNCLQKYLICVLQQQQSSGLARSGVEGQTVNVWQISLGFRGLLYPTVLRSAENTCGTHLSWLLSPWQCSDLGELSQGCWCLPRCALCSGFGQVLAPPGIKITDRMKFLMLECSQALCCWEFQGQPENQDLEFKAGAALQLFQRLTPLFSLQFASIWGYLFKLGKPFKGNGYTNNNNLSWNYLLGLNSVLSWKWEQWPVGSWKEWLSVWEPVLLWFWYIIKNDKLS